MEQDSIMRVSDPSHTNHGELLQHISVNTSDASFLGKKFNGDLAQAPVASMSVPKWTHLQQLLATNGAEAPLAEIVNNNTYKLRR